MEGDRDNAGTVGFKHAQKVAMEIKHSGAVLVGHEQDVFFRMEGNDREATMDGDLAEEFARLHVPQQHGVQAARGDQLSIRVKVRAEHSLGQLQAERLLAGNGVPGAQAETIRAEDSRTIGRES